MQRPLLTLAALAALAGGCYWPSFADCQIRCSDDHRCPGGMSCDNGLCTHPRGMHCSPPAPPMSCDMGGGACSACLPPPSPETRAELFVGSDAAATTSSQPYCPFATITAALRAAAAVSSPVTIHVGPGRYDRGHGEQFPLVLRGDLTLIGAGRDVTTVEGYGSFDHTSDGGAFIGNAQAATMVLGDAAKTVRVSGMTIESGRPLLTDGAYTFGLFCDRGSATAAALPQPQRNTIVDDVTIGPGYHSALVVTSSAGSGCNLSLARSSISDSGRGAWLVGCAPGGTGRQGVAATIGDGTPGGGNSFHQIYGQRATTRDPGLAIAIDGCTTELIADGNQISDSGVGIFDDEQEPTHLVIRNNELANLAASGVLAAGQASIDELRGNRFERIRAGDPWWQPYGGIGAALVLRDGAQVRKARGNLFLGNNTGVRIEGAAVSASRVLDFGTSDDQGNNIFRCNARLDGDTGFGVWVDVANGSTSPLAFAGNQWDHRVPKTGNSPNSPNGTDVVNSSPSPAPLVQTDASRQATVAAPVEGGWYYGQTEAQVTAALSAHQARLTSLQVETASPPRFTVSMVQNSGCYARTWYWFYDQTADQMSGLINQYHARIADLDAYVRDNTLLFAAILIEQSDVDATGWWWWYGVDGNDIASLTAQYNARLITMHEYTAVNGVNQYALLMYDNTGANATSWWYYPRVTQPELQMLLMQHQAYPVDIEPAVGSSTSFNVVMHADPGFKWSWYPGETAAELGMLDTSVWRPVNVKSYFAGDQRRLSAIAVDNL
jgi:hypothetical protein